MRFSKEIRKILICGLESIGKRHFETIQQHYGSIEIAILRSGIGPTEPEIERKSQFFYCMNDALRWDLMQPSYTPASNQI